jgi:hypothetical protein
MDLVDDMVYVSLHAAEIAALPAGWRQPGPRGMPMIKRPNEKG